MTKLCYGSIAQLVRAPALQAGGHWFESSCSHQVSYASVAQMVEQRTENPRVVGSIPTGGTTRLHLEAIRLRPVRHRAFLLGDDRAIRQRFICGRSSSGRAPPCQGGGSEFEPRRPLQFFCSERSRNLYSETRRTLEQIQNVSFGFGRREAGAQRNFSPEGAARRRKEQRSERLRTMAP